MKVICSAKVEGVLENYWDILNDPDSIYVKSEENADKLYNELYDAIMSLGTNYNVEATICPWPRLGQRKGKDGYARRKNLGMKRYKNWTIAFVVYPNKDKIVVTDLVYAGYNLINRIPIKKGDKLVTGTNNLQHQQPIQECLLWMVKLGCFNQYQVESLKERGIL